MKKIYVILLVVFSFQVHSQELFVVTEPASNVPAGSLGFKLGHSLMDEKYKESYNYHILPEITWGINKSIMVRATGFISNRTTSNRDLKTEGGALYAKFRILSVDDLHSHFRMSVFGRYSVNNSDIHQEEIETMGHNSGFEAGIVATKLNKKVAISTNISLEKAINNEPENPFPANQSNMAFNYTLSFGKLMYPKHFSNFKQTNINLMLELEGQTLNENQKSFLDVVPSIQFIVNSQARIDLAYKQELYSSMVRSSPNGFYLNLQYTFFNIKRSNKKKE